jgi:hypothetical protein
VSLLVDTSVWSLALRRDVEQSAPEVLALRHALLGADQVFTTGLVLQELMQGFAGPKHRAQLVERLSALAFLQPAKDDHLEFGGSSKLPPTSRRANELFDAADGVEKLRRWAQSASRGDADALTSIGSSLPPGLDHNIHLLADGPRGIASERRRYRAAAVQPHHQLQIEAGADHLLPDESVGSLPSGTAESKGECVHVRLSSPGGEDAHRPPSRDWNGH